MLVAVLLLPAFGASPAHAASYPTSIANAQAETPSATNPTLPEGWHTGNWGANTASFTYSTTGQSGRGLQVDVSSYSDGDAKWYFDPIAVTPGKQYIFSDSYKATVPTEVVAQFTTAEGSNSYLYLGGLSSANSWQAASFNFTAPANAQAVTIFHLINKVGSLQTDNYDISPVAPPPPVIPFESGIIPNGSVEATVAGNPSQPQSWQTGSWGANTTTFSYLNTGHTGSHSLKVNVTNYTDGDAKWYAIPQVAVPNQSYDFSDYYQSTASTDVYAMITSTGGTTTYQYLGSASSSTTWKQFHVQFSAPANAATISILHLIAKKGTLITDDYNLTPYSPVGFNRGIVSLTFDDGWADQYTNGLPILQQYHMPATFYLVAGFLNTPDYLTTKQAKALRTAGEELGSHSYSHLDLTSLNATKLNKETLTAKTRLQSLLGGNITNFASPYGAYNDTVQAKIKSVYGSHRTVIPGYNSKNGFDRYTIKVQNITDTTTAADVQEWVNFAQTNHVWLVLVYHQVTSDPTTGEYNTTPQQLKDQLAVIQRSGLPVETIAQALAEITPQLP